MRWKKADVLAGLFVIAGAALILAIIITVRGQFSAPDRYHTFFKNVAGLRAGAAVVYEGYIIGEVVTIAPVPDDSGMRFRIDIGIEAGWVIPSDSLAEISAVSLLSANAVQIMAGSAEPLLETIRDVLEGEGRDALASVSVLGEALADETPRIMSNLESATANMATITGGDNAASITRTISNLERASEGAIQAVDEVVVVAETVGRVASDANLGRVDSILTRMDAAAIELEALLATASDTLQRTDAVVSDENLRLVTTILQDMQTLQTGVGEIIEASHATSQNALRITTLGEDRIEGFLQRMESAALNVEEMTARLRDDPSLLIRGRD
ncbi:MAG: MCE family protein [Alphaproteobacteria bacterium]|nr:MCE family protein [Alphaproteobacteria bacterium]